MTGTTLPEGKRYDIVYADPPWFYRPLQNRLAGGGYVTHGASLHYPLMTDKAIHALPVRDLMADKAALFLWATCPRLDVAIATINAWGLHFRGVAYVWVKTRLDGRIMGATGPIAAFVKPVTEVVLVATTIKQGRVFPILEYNQSQVVLAPRSRHSAKPEAVRNRIVALCGDRPRIELFARDRSPGWDHWGNEITEGIAT